MYLLMVHSSFAIWNKNKVVVAIAGAVWVTNLSFLLQGEFLPCISIMMRHDEHG
jgi:hypothetical protein